MPPAIRAFDMTLNEASQLIEAYYKAVQKVKPEMYSSYHIMGSMSGTLAMLFSGVQTIDEAIEFFKRETIKYENNG